MTPTARRTPSPAPSEAPPPAPPRGEGALDPWRASARTGRQLGAWAAASVAIGGGLMALRSGPTLWAFGLQCLVWGAIDGAIAIAGAVALRRAHARGKVDDPAQAAPERRRLRRLLWINAYLDVGYLVVGALLLAAWRTPEGTGHGLGVLVQGGFLMVFDVVHARRLRER